VFFRVVASGSDTRSCLLPLTSPPNYGLLKTRGTVAFRAAQRGTSRSHEEVKIDRGLDDGPQPFAMRLTSARVNSAVVALPPRPPVRTLSMFSVASMGIGVDVSSQGQWRDRSPLTNSRRACCIVRPDPKCPTKCTGLFTLRFCVVAVRPRRCRGLATTAPPTTALTAGLWTATN